MRRRVLYLMPDLSSSRKIMDDLLLARVEARHIHFLAKRGTPMDGLHEANILHKSDIVHGLQLGLGIGAVLGCALGALVAAVFLKDDTLRIIAVLGAAVLGALFGGWVSSMVGSAVPNSRLKHFDDAIAQGKLLVLVDVPEHRVEEVRALLQRNHPEAECCGLDPHVPAFP
jgi:hypothetical protein